MTATAPNAVRFQSLTQPDGVVSLSSTATGGKRIIDAGTKLRSHRVYSFEHRALGLLAGTSLALLLRSVSLASPCPGDCNVDAVTSVNELVSCVNLALGRGAATCPKASCDADGNGTLAINDLIRSVNRALTDCNADFAQAAVGVVGSGTDAVDAVQVLDFGIVGAQTTGAALSGDAADRLASKAASLVQTAAPLAHTRVPATPA